MFTPLLIVLAAILADNAVFVQPKKIAVIQKWKEAQRNVKTVHAEFRQYRFDNVFKSCKVIKGEVISSSPTNGFILFAPWPEKEASATVTRVGEKYELKTISEEAIIWSKGNVAIVDVHKKTYQEFPQGACLFFKMPFFPSITSAMPFLPGMPDKKVFSEWSFELVSENEKEIRLSATPPEELKSQFHSYDLILHKPEMNLYAVRCNHLGRNSTTVTVFTAVKCNPEKMPLFDLVGYQRIQ